MPSNLERTLQALQDCGIGATITSTEDGFDVTPCKRESYSGRYYHDTELIATVKTAAEIADTLRRLAVDEYPDSEFAISQGKEKPCPSS